MGIDIRELWFRAFIAICLSVVALAAIVQISRANPAQEGQNVEVSQTGVASWYSNKEYPPGSLMANGEKFDDENFTCASWDHDLGSLLKVTALPRLGEVGRGNDQDDDASKSVVVRVTDRGPAKWLYKQGRIIDLTKTAFAKIASLEQGLAKVKVEVVNDKSRNQKR